MVKECKHQNRKRLYERGKSWSSTPLYICQDCGEVVKVGLEKVKPVKEDLSKKFKSKVQDAILGDSVGREV